MQLDKIGIWTSLRALGEENGAAAATLAERLGYGALWIGGSPRLPSLRPLLAATERLVIATGIVNVWAYDPVELARDNAELIGEYPGRLLLGIGIGHPEATSEYTKPLTKMRTFLDGLAAAPQPVAREQMCIAALGPKMLDLSFERTLGTHPYFVPPRHTEVARKRLGPNALVAPELAVVVDTDPAGAKAKARAYAKLYLGLTNYTSNLLNLGFTEADIGNGGSDALIDAVVPQGSPEQLAAVVHAHLDAGADHVCVQTAGVAGVPEAEWTALAKELL